MLLRNDGTLPLGAPARIAVIGPNADDPYAVLGCYSFPSHVGAHHPEVPIGIELPTLLDARARGVPGREVDYVRGTTVDGGETDEFDAAVAAAQPADVVVLALGDRAGLFGRGTSGEGCDAESLDAARAPSRQLRRRGARHRHADRASRCSPAGRTRSAPRPPRRGRDRAVVLPRRRGRTRDRGRAERTGQPERAPAGERARATPAPSRRPTSPRPSATAPRCRTSTRRRRSRSATASATRASRGRDPTSSADRPSTTEVTVSLTVTNTGDRAGAEVVQLYLHDPAASVVRPVQRLIAFARVELDAGESATHRRSGCPPTSRRSPVATGAASSSPASSCSSSAARRASPCSSRARTLTGPVRHVDHTRRAPRGHRGHPVVSDAFGHRRGARNVIVTRPDGTPLVDQEVVVEQVRHDFGFGNIGFDLIPHANGEESLDRLAADYVELFNTATLPFYWGQFEPERGKPATRVAAHRGSLVRRPRHPGEGSPPGLAHGQGAVARLRCPSTRSSGRPGSGSGARSATSPG